MDQSITRGNMLGPFYHLVLNPMTSPFDQLLLEKDVPIEIYLIRMHVHKNVTK